jgi:hypothetical protein
MSDRIGRGIVVRSTSTMRFTSRNGTRGARQPRIGALARWFTKRWVKRIERIGGKFMGMNLLVLTAVGKKTGMERQTPLAWFPAPNPLDSEAYADDFAEVKA